MATKYQNMLSSHHCRLLCSPYLIQADLLKSFWLLRFHLHFVANVEGVGVVNLSLWNVYVHVMKYEPGEGHGEPSYHFFLPKWPHSLTVLLCRTFVSQLRSSACFLSSQRHYLSTQYSSWIKQSWPQSRPSRGPVSLVGKVIKRPDFLHGCQALSRPDYLTTSSLGPRLFFIRLAKSTFFLDSVSPLNCYACVPCDLYLHMLCPWIYEITGFLPTGYGCRSD